MDVISYIEVSIGVIKQNKSRSILTMLGIIIGVAAVIAMLSVGTGAKKSIESRMSSLGNNVLQIFPGSFNSGGVRGGFGTRSSLTPEDAEAIRTNIADAGIVAPIANASVQVVYGTQNWATRVQGTTPEFFTIKSWDVQSGSIFSEEDVTSVTKVCVIGKTIVDNLFKEEDPIGKIIRVNNVPFTVAGVLTEKGSSFGGNQDDAIFMPYTTAMKRLSGNSFLNNIQISVTNSKDISEVQKQITELLVQRHHIAFGQENDFSIMNMADIMAAAASMANVMTMLLGSVASVSLLVGGIGIMNIMLVSVTERTREIGIRMAVGAKQKEILYQFVIEALMLSVAGGLIGIVIGVLISLFIAVFAKWSISISGGSIILAFFFSLGVGVFFGYYPARRAASLDPIEALRYE